jgi:hypothetical protein
MARRKHKNGLTCFMEWLEEKRVEGCREGMLEAYHQAYEKVFQKSFREGKLEILFDLMESGMLMPAQVRQQLMTL